MDMTQTEYLERLVNLLPDSAFVGKRKLVCDKESLVHSSQMVEAIAEEMFKAFDKLAQTDYVLDLKDASINLAVLGRYLTNSYLAVDELINELMENRNEL